VWGINEIGTVYAAESCKIVFLGGIFYSLPQTLLLSDVSFSHNTQRHRQTNRETDRERTVSWQ